MPHADPLAELDQIHQRLTALATAESRRPMRAAIQAAAARVLDALELQRGGATRPDPPPRQVSRILTAPPPKRRR